MTNNATAHVYFVAYARAVRGNHELGNAYVPLDRAVTTVGDVEYLSARLRQCYPSAVVLSFTLLPGEPVGGTR